MNNNNQHQNSILSRWISGIMSNQKALEKIKFDNTEALVKGFINNIGLLKHTCDVK